MHETQSNNDAARDAGHDEYLMRGATSIIGGQQWQSVVIQRGNRIICGTETAGGAQTGPRLDVSSDLPQDGVDYEALAEFAATSPAERTNHSAGKKWHAVKPLEGLARLSDQNVTCTITCE